MSSHRSPIYAQRLSRSLGLLILVLCLLLTTHVDAQPFDSSIPATTKPALTSEVDKLFADWNKRDTPGCALAVVKDGRIIYKRGYGLANLEYGIRNRPSTVFHVASVSKQFTAFAIHLLAQEGKLSLDDDVRKYLPELHDFGKTITIRHLIHHTSGLRDQWSLLMLGGWRIEDVITEQDILRLVWRQKELNFPPGEEELYSNTGYTLLALIVKRVSGKSFPEFTQERIFKPLGMQHTHFHDKYGFLVKNRAYSYSPLEGGKYEYVALSYSNVGATSLFTTVEDLARWDENFYSGRIGGKPALAEMQKKGKLNNGKEIAYASALFLGEYRGLKTVEHSGGDAGYRADLLRFPDQHFSVILLSNAANFNPVGLSQRVADIYLKEKMKPAPSDPAASPSATKRSEIKIDPKLLDSYIGDYELMPGFLLTFTRENNQLMVQPSGQQKIPIFPSSETDFFLKVVDAQLTFVKPREGGDVQTVILHQGGRDTPAKRIKRIPLTEDQLKEYTGDFYSEELNALYRITLREGKLFMNYPRGEVEMTSTLPDTFAADFPIGTLRFLRSAEKVCNGFTLSQGRVRNLRFVKAEVLPVGRGSTGVSQ